MAQAPAGGRDRGASVGDPGERQSLRVGLLMDSYRQPAWVKRMLERLVEASFADIAFVIMAGDVEPDAPLGVRGRLARYWESRHHLLYAAYRRFDRRRDLMGPDAHARTDTAELLDGIPVLEVVPRRTKFSDYFPDDDLEAIREQRLDVLVRLGFRILRGDILEVASCGVWSFHHGDNRVNRGGPAGFWEVMLGWPCTGSILQILNEDLDGGFVLARSWAATNPVSVRENRNGYYWQSLSMLPRKLEELQRLGREPFLARHADEQDVPNFYSNRLFQKPTNREIVGPLIRVHANLVKRKLDHMAGWEQWELRYELRDSLGSSLWRMKPLVPPRDRFWADPHVVRREGLYHVFIEELPYASMKGRIAVLTIDDDGNASEPRTVLERDYHLSYPFLFERDGELFMIPETCDQGRIELYRCERFPDRWTPERTLMEDVTAVDATLLEHGDRWWMFTSIREETGAPFGDELFVFHTDDPVAGRWEPHPRNPVVSDVRSARPAGAFIREGGEILRPAQDGSREYGWAVRIHRVEELTPETYREREVSTLMPGFAPEVRGIHSLARAGRLTMIDARSWRWGRRG